MAPSADLTDRAALAARTVPVMTLSDGTATSMTPPPNVPIIATDPAQGAKDRFTVRGNAIVAGGAGTLGPPRVQRRAAGARARGSTIFDLNPANAQKEIAAMQAKFPAAKIRSLAVDVTDEEAVEAAVAEAARELGPINALLSFVGVVGCVPTLEMPVSQWRR